MKHKTQDSKFWIEDGRLVGQSGPVPEDEPLFILRARDVGAAAALRYYQGQCLARGAHTNHLSSVQTRIDEFVQFSKEHPDRMLLPDTDPSLLHDRKVE